MSKHIDISDKRERILRAAVKVFSAKGFHEAKVEEIARLADVGKGTVYEYFSSKMILFQELFKAGFGFYGKQISEELVSDACAADKLRQIARMHLKFMVEYKDLAKVLMTEHAHFDEEFRLWMEKTRKEKLVAIEGVIIAGIERGEFAKDIEPHAVAVIFNGMLGALFGPVVMEEKSSEELDKVLGQMLEIVLRGIMVNP